MGNHSRLARRPLPLVAVLFAAVVLLILMGQSLRGLVFLATDGAVAAGILLSACLGGLWLVKLIAGEDWPLRWHLLLGAGLGIGALSLLVLGLGLLGRLDRTLWIGLLLAMGLGGLPRLAFLVRREREPPNSKLETGNSKLASLWLLAAPFAALALLAALVPPGLLWAEEGNGYDTLEYHLQVPREYFESGRIAYAPHNVYANFPSNVEMLYLVAMIVQGDAVQGAMVGQIINALMAFLAVAAAWLAGREISPAVGHVTGVLAATCGWLVYLSGVAYVENTMLFFGTLAAAAVGSALRATGARAMGPQSGRYKCIVVAGLLAGLSAGCKYTAAVLIVIPLAMVVLAGAWESHRRRLTVLAIFGLSAAATFTPWMLKNAGFTGNPVFPLAGAVFRNYPEGWSAENAVHFAQCHGPAPEESGFGFRLRTLWKKVIADDAQRFGPGLFLLAALGAILGRGSRLARDYAVVGPAIMLLIQGVLWLAFTHLYARFAVVFLIPLVMLGGQLFIETKPLVRWLGASILVAGGVWNLAFMADLYRRHLYSDGQRISIEGTPEAFTGGHMPSYEHLRVINAELPQNARILLVGEARAFYFLCKVDYRVVFNRDQFIELLKSAPAPAEARAWLSERGYTHVYVAWSEIRRLSRSRYGFHEIQESQAHAAIELLADGGAIKRTHVFSVAGVPSPYAELYEVVHPGISTLPHEVPEIDPDYPRSHSALGIVGGHGVLHGGKSMLDPARAT